MAQSTAEIFSARSPWDGHEVGTLPVATVADMERAIASASAAARATAAIPRYERQAVLRRTAAALVEARERLARLMVEESGKPLRFARIEVDRAVSTFSLAADEVTRPIGEMLPLDVTAAGVGYTAMTQRRAIGLVGAIAPFNFPLNLVAHKLAPAMAVGNTVVLKAPPQAPLCAHELVKIVHAAGWPAHALQVMHAPIEVAQALATDERVAMLSFTGSAKVGWYLKSIAGKKRVALELGGNAAAIVCEDADLDWAAKRTALGSYAQSGQVCIKVQRVYVARNRYDTFLQRLLVEIDALGVGDPSNDATVVGPMIDAANADRVVAWVEEARAAGATILRQRTREGNVIAPILLSDTKAEMKVECEEIFGPVATIAAVDSLDEAIARTNASRYGLQAGIFTHDIRAIATAFDNLDVGGVIVNDYPTLRIDNFPYGGIKDSGFGREGVRYAMDEMSELKVLVAKYR
ncbi:MAG TPA: aldehyde dehydrogenase family protein [Candidatus Baltobacteraceae bacterium]|nr:aldehyde dehydrogenase family protein [Candidatus Baltobacteraceae bacterium]